MKTVNIVILRTLGLGALFMALGLNISCGKSEFKANDNAQAQETGDNTVDTDVDGVDNGNTTTTNTDNCNNTNGTTGVYNNNGTYTGNGTYNQNCNQSYNTNCQQTTQQGCSNFPTNTSYQFPTNFQTNNVFVQQVPVVREIFVTQVHNNPIVQFASPTIRYNSVVYEVAPLDCILDVNTFTTVYRSVSNGAKILVEGTILNNQIQAQIHYPQANSFQNRVTTVRYNRW